MDILVGGDVCFGRWFKSTYISYSKRGCLDALRDIPRDYFMCNLENPLSNAHDLRDMSKNATLAGHPGDTTHLLSAGVDFASVANNHALDLNSKGLEDTCSALDDVGISWAGAFGKYAHIDHERRLILLPSNFILDDGSVEYDPSLVSIHENFIGEFLALRNEYPEYLIFIFPHWGYEYSVHANKGQIRLAKKWIDLGADAVVGAHAHVLQEAVVYKGKPILFGQGNLYFLHKNPRYYNNPQTHTTRVTLLSFKGREFLGGEHTPLKVLNDKVERGTY